MTAPEQREPEQPAPGADALPAIEPAVEREFEAIAVDSLDKENRTWTVKYLDGLRERLNNEQAAAQPDFVMISYIKREIATYQELLDRTDKN